MTYKGIDYENLLKEHEALKHKILMLAGECQQLKVCADIAEVILQTGDFRDAAAQAFHYYNKHKGES